MYSEEERRRALDLWFARPGEVSTNRFVEELGYPSARTMRAWVAADPRRDPDKATYRSKPVLSKLVAIRRVSEGASLARAGAEVGLTKAQVRDAVDRYARGGTAELLPRPRKGKREKEGAGVRAIARAIGRDPATVSRELRRNSCKRFYRASTAQRRSEERRLACRRPRVLDDPGLRALVQGAILARQWSPDQVSGRLARELGRPVVSASTIYRGIRARELDTPGLARTAKGLAGRLRRKGKAPKEKGDAQPRGKIKVDRQIGERPEGAESRSRLGDRGADTVVGEAGGPRLVTLVDRRSRYLVGGLSPSGRSEDVCAAMGRALEGQPLACVTPDRGKEFARWKGVEGALGVPSCFTLPHCPWQRGTNENTNGLLRERFPKGKSLEGVTEEEVQEACDRINMRPRKCLGYRTPWEVHHSQMLHLI